MKKYKKEFAESLVKIHPNTKKLLLNKLEDKEETLDKSSKLDDTLTFKIPLKTQRKKI